MGYVQIIFVLSVLIYLTKEDFSIAQQQAPVVQDVKIKSVVPSLPSSHYQFWLKNHPRIFAEFKQICSQVFQPLDLLNQNYFRTLHANLSLEDPRYLLDSDHGRKVLHDICAKIDLVPNSCWGYESNCQNIYLMPECYGFGKSSQNELQEQKKTWFNLVDFGYILDLRKGMQRFCMPDKYSNDTWKSSLECTKHFKTCRGDNLMINLKSKTNVVDMDKKNLFSAGDIGGWRCDLQTKRIREEKGQQEPLQSWFNELENYSLVTDVNPQACDLIIDKQSIIIKLDSPNDMYSYFSTFLNLYATIHLNNRFSEDNQIIVWDDLPRSKFDPIWMAFTRNPLLSVKQFLNKRVCLKKFIFALPPRTLGGLYQGIKLVQGCSKSGLFDAFNKHILHRLGIRQRYNNEFDRQKFNQTLRVTLVSKSDPHRTIVNQDELVSALLAKSSDYQVSAIDLSEKPLREQMDIAQNTDILIGISGAAMTNLLFLPDWAALVELHDSGEKTYNDLARLRGVRYFLPRYKSKFSTKLSTNDVKIGLIKKNLLYNDKISNYRINVDEFLNMFEKAADFVKKNRMRHFGDTFEQPKIEEEAIKNEHQSKSNQRVEL